MVAARTAGEQVVPAPPVELVVASAAFAVSSSSPPRSRRRRTAIEHVVALAAEDLVVPAEPLNVVGPGRAVQQVVAGGADDALRERDRGHRSERDG